MSGGDATEVQLEDADGASVQELIERCIPSPADRLELRDQIASGGMGSIRVAYDRALERRVAIKFLHADHQHASLTVRSFIREAHITGQLDHPNIVPVHELGLDGDGQLYFTMKLVEGRTLHDLIEAVRATHERKDENGRTVATAADHDDLLRMLDVFNKVLDAVAFAHSRGVIHLDLKPENVMVGDYGQVYLMDWGIAKVLPAPVGEDPLSASRRVSETLPLPPIAESVVMGTPAYMSPEQARGDQRHIDAHSDIFALGAILFEILTGHPPYQGRSAVEILLLAEDCEVELPEELPISREMRRVVARAMAREPAERYPTAEEFQRDLQRFMRGGGNFPRQRFAAGDWIIRENEVGDAAYILVSGRCEVFKHIDGRWESLRTLGPGDVFGETAILASTPRTASVVALTDVLAVVVTAEVLESEVDAMKPWVGAFIRALAQRFSEGEEKRRLAAMGLERQDPAQIANQAMMVLKGWGKWDRDAGWTMSLGRLCGAVKSFVGLSQAEILAVLEPYEQFHIDHERDLISLRDDLGLQRELEQFLRF